MVSTKKTSVFAALLAVTLLVGLCGCDLSADISDQPQQTTTTTVIHTTVSQTTSATTMKTAKAATVATTVKTTTTTVATTAASTATKAPEITVNTTVGLKAYIYPTGTKFHIKAGCSGDNYSEVTMEYAKEHGYTACKKCAKAYAE